MKRPRAVIATVTALVAGRPHHGIDQSEPGPRSWMADWACAMSSGQKANVRYRILGNTSCDGGTCTTGRFASLEPLRLKKPSAKADPGRLAGADPSDTVRKKALDNSAIPTSAGPKAAVCGITQNRGLTSRTNHPSSHCRTADGLARQDANRIGDRLTR